MPPAQAATDRRRIYGSRAPRGVPLRVRLGVRQVEQSFVLATLPARWRWRSRRAGRSSACRSLRRPSASPAPPAWARST
jgi:hypothetical protein